MRSPVICFPATATSPFVPKPVSFGNLGEMFGGVVPLENFCKYRRREHRGSGPAHFTRVN